MAVRYGARVAAQSGRWQRIPTSRYLHPKKEVLASAHVSATMTTRGVGCWPAKRR
jgi:hypothetical protein